MEKNKNFIEEKTLADWKKIFRFVVIDDEVHIKGYKSAEEIVYIPSEIDQKKVKYIAEKAFRGCDTISFISIPDSVVEIGKSAFSRCNKLKEILIPQSVVSIGSSAFACCEKLESITIPEGIKKIETSCFHGCTKLVDVALPNTLEEIGCLAFCLCESIKNIIIPDGVKKIGPDAFALCYSLENIEIPENVTKLQHGTFARCGLKNITIHKKMKRIELNAFDCKKFEELRVLGEKTKLIGLPPFDCDNGRICAASGSLAEIYAQENNIQFVEI